MTVVVDAAGGQVGGAARFRAELSRYLARSKRADVRIIGMARQVDPAWLVRREMARSSRGRRVALNNVSFITPGSERWTLLRNPLDFLTDHEESSLESSVRAATRRRVPVVRLAARRADVLVVPSTAMAERVTDLLPGVRDRVVVRPHPVSADSIPRKPRMPVILCPVLFSPYKGMTERLTELLTAMDQAVAPTVQLLVTADRTEVPSVVACNPRVELVGQLDHRQLRQLWASSRAIYFPPGIESFGYPLAEARVNGQPVIARDTAQNREIAGSALCGFTPGDAESLRHATTVAMMAEVAPDPGPFDPDAYFTWLLGSPQ
jgi:glycosyltransferase involved in cell wall biosynthesis